MSSEPVTEPTVAETAAPAVDTTTEETAPTATEAAEAPATAAASETPVAVPDAAAAPAATELPKEEAAGEGKVKVEATPVSEGILGYKAPGLIKCVLSAVLVPSSFG